jgi:hypothetical protein
VRGIEDPPPVRRLDLGLRDGLEDLRGVHETGEIAAAVHARVHGEVQVGERQDPRLDGELALRDRERVLLEHPQRLVHGPIAGVLDALVQRMPNRNAGAGGQLREIPRLDAVAPSDDEDGETRRARRRALVGMAHAPLRHVGQHAQRVVAGRRPDVDAEGLGGQRSPARIADGMLRPERGERDLRTGVVAGLVPLASVEEGSQRIDVVRREVLDAVGLQEREGRIPALRRLGRATRSRCGGSLRDGVAAAQQRECEEE